MTMPESTRKRPRGGMIRKSRREFKAGELVHLFNFRLKLFLGKLKSRWSGPYIVVTSTPYGAVTLKTEFGTEFRVNG